MLSMSPNSRHPYNCWLRYLASSWCLTAEVSLPEVNLGALAHAQLHPWDCCLFVLAIICNYLSLSVCSKEGES